MSESALPQPSTDPFSDAGLLHHDPVTRATGSTTTAAFSSLLPLYGVSQSRAFGLIRRVSTQVNPPDDPPLLAKV